MRKELLHKFLNNQCSSKELQEVINWVKTDALNKDGESINYQEWNKYAGEEFSSDKVRMDNMLDKIHHKINIGQAYTPPNNKPKISIITWLTRVAAILFIPVITFLLFELSQHNLSEQLVSEVQIDSLEIIAPIGSKTIVQLSDGSEVFLNHGSKLKYPQKFVGDSRNVILSGEGYFKVAHNPEKPFVVSTRDLHIKALGTEFNVLAYENEDVVETTLVNGVVALEQVKTNGGNEVLGRMNPSQHVRYYPNSGKIISTEGDIEKYISWKEGRLIFKNEPIEQIANKLNRWYNVEIEFETDEVKDLTYTATFVDETLFQILDLMQLATPIRYKVIPRTKLEGGTFSKQKIIIRLNSNT